MPETPKEALDNNIAPKYKIYLNGLGMKKVKAGGVSTMLKIGMEAAQDYTNFNYGPPSLQKDLKFQVRKIVSQPGINPAPEFVLPGNIQ